MGSLVAEGVGIVGVIGSGVEVGSIAGVDTALSIIVAAIEVEFAAVSLVCVSPEQAVQRHPDKTPNKRIPLMKGFMLGVDLPGPQACTLFVFQIQPHVFPDRSVQTQAPEPTHALPGLSR